MRDEIALPITNGEFPDGMPCTLCEYSDVLEIGVFFFLFVFVSW
jgi:hypothetical protein